MVLSILIREFTRFDDIWHTWRTTISHKRNYFPIRKIRIWWKRKAIRVHKNHFGGCWVLFLSCIEITDIIKTRIMEKKKRVEQTERGGKKENRRGKKDDSNPVFNSQVSKISSNWTTFSETSEIKRRMQMVQNVFVLFLLIKGQRTMLSTVWLYEIY